MSLRSTGRSRPLAHQLYGPRSMRSRSMTSNLVAYLDRRVNDARMSVFHFSNYKEFVREWVREARGRGRGQYRAIAGHLRVHTSLISHVFRGSKDLTSEQACALADFLGLPELEADYFMGLVERDRAGTDPLRRALERRLAGLREKNRQLEYRVPVASSLTREEQSIFYSQWYYSAIRLTASLDGFDDATSIANRLQLPVHLVESEIAFLVSAGLLQRVGDRYSLATKRTHIGSSSPLASAHHRNWRAKAMSLYDRMTSKDFAFTAPMALSSDDLERIRELLVNLVQDATRIVEASPCETVAVLNIDLLEF